MELNITNSNSEKRIFTNSLLGFSTNESHPVIEEAEEYSFLFEFIIVGIGITIVSCLGILGNILSACVLSRSQMKSSVTTLLLGLTVADTILIFTSLLLFGLPALFNFFAMPETTPNFYMKVIFPSCGPYVYAVAVTGKDFVLIFRNLFMTYKSLRIFSQ